MIESPHIFPSVAPIWAQYAGPEDPEASPATGPPRRFRAQPRAERSVLESIDFTVSANPTNWFEAASISVSELCAQSSAKTGRDRSENIRDPGESSLRASHVQPLWRVFAPRNSR